MRWYLTTPPREFSEWLPLAISRDIPNVSLPTAEPEAAVIGEGWSIFPLTDEPPTLNINEIIDEREIVIEDDTAVAVYTVRTLTNDEREDKNRGTTSKNVLAAPKQGFGGPTGKDIFNGNQ